MQGLLEILSEALESKAPSRFLCIIPKQETLPSYFLELATFNPSSPLLLNKHLDVPMSMILAMNKESMLTDKSWTLVGSLFQVTKFKSFIGLIFLCLLCGVI